MYKSKNYLVWMLVFIFSLFIASCGGGSGSGGSGGSGNGGIGGNPSLLGDGDNPNRDVRVFGLKSADSLKFLHRSQRDVLSDNISRFIIYTADENLEPIPSSVDIYRGSRFLFDRTPYTTVASNNRLNPDSQKNLVNWELWDELKSAPISKTLQYSNQRKLIYNFGDYPSTCCGGFARSYGRDQYGLYLQYTDEQGGVSAIVHISPGQIGYDVSGNYLDDDTRETYDGETRLLVFGAKATTFDNIIFPDGTLYPLQDIPGPPLPTGEYTYNGTTIETHFQTPAVLYDEPSDYPDRYKNERNFISLLNDEHIYHGNFTMTANFDQGIGHIVTNTSVGGYESVLDATVPIGLNHGTFHNDLPGWHELAGLTTWSINDPNSTDDELEYRETLIHGAFHNEGATGVSGIYSRRSIRESSFDRVIGYHGAFIGAREDLRSGSE